MVDDDNFNVSSDGHADGGIEVELPGGDDHNVEQPIRQAAPRQRKGVPLSKRINQLTYEKKVLEEQLQQSEWLRQQERVHLENERVAYEQHLALKEQEEIESTQAAINQNEQLVLREMRRAKEEQDINSEMKWQAELTSLQKAQAQLEGYKAAKSSSQDDQDYIVEPLPQSYMPIPPQQTAPTITNPYMQEWMDSTPWANPNDPNYSPEVMNEADQVAAHFNTKLKLAGQAHVIGRPEYFQAITDVIEERHGIKNIKNSSSHQLNQNYSSAPIGAVSRQGATMAEQYAQQQSRHPNRS